MRIRHLVPLVFMAASRVVYRGGTHRRIWPVLPLLVLGPYLVAELRRSPARWASRPKASATLRCYRLRSRACIGPTARAACGEWRAWPRFFCAVDGEARSASRLRVAGAEGDSMNVAAQRQRADSGLV